MARMKRIIVDTIRWIMILPTMIVVHVLSYYLYLWLSDDAHLSIIKYVEIIMAFAVSAGASVVAGSIVAPKHRKMVSVILCVFLCTLMLVGLYIMVVRFSEYGTMSILGNVASIVGAIAGAYIIYKEMPEE